MIRSAWRRLALALPMVALLVATASAGVPPPLDEPITPIPEPAPFDARQAMIGAALFADPRLSGNLRVSCASCHDLQTNGATSRPRDLAPDGHSAKTNTITVFNAALNFRLNWAGNVLTLEEESANAIQDSAVMAGKPADIISALRRDGSFSRRFKAAYERLPDWDGILDSIAVFERTLLTPDSPFDRWLRGDRSALTEEQAKGYALFKSIGCVSCHQGANVGGNLFEQTGVAAAWLGGHKLLRVPSLRNVAVTAPYFDDGSAPSLHVAVRRMAAGQLGLSLSDAQIDLIVAFLHSLTGNFQGHPLTAPP